MSQVVRIGTWLTLVGAVLLAQGCWDQASDEYTFLGEGGCRTIDGGEGAPTHVSDVTMEQCQARCVADEAQCTAFEYNANNSKCELHRQSITRFAEVAGVSCYVAKTARSVSQAKL